MRATRGQLAVVVCAVLAATMGPVHAEDGQGAPTPPAPPAGDPAPPADQAKLDEAQKYYQAGKQAYSAGQFFVAITAFEEAYKLAPRPTVKFSLAMAYRAQYFIDQDTSKVRRAVELFRAFVEEVPQGELREKAVGFLAELSPTVMRLDELERQKADDEARARAEAQKEKERLAAAQNPGPDGQPGGEPPKVEPPKVEPPKIEPPRIEPPPAPKTQLMVSSRTVGARAAIDGDPLTDVPVIKEVAPGKHKVRVELDGYFAQTVDGVAVDGRLIVVEANLQPRPARLTIHAPDGADVTLDGKPVGTAPIRQPLEVPAGSHTLVVVARGHYAHAQELELARGEERKVSVRLDRTKQRRTALVVLGGAGVLATAGLVTNTLAILAASDAEAIEDKIERGENITPAQVDAHTGHVADRDSYRSATTVLYGSAFVVATAGVFLYFVDTPRVEATERRTAPSVAPTPEGDGFTVSLTTWF